MSRYRDPHVKRATTPPVRQSRAPAAAGPYPTAAVGTSRRVVPVRCAGCGNAYLVHRRLPHEGHVVEIVTGCCSLCPPGRSSSGLTYIVRQGRP